MVSTNVDHHLDVDFWVDCSYTYIHIIPLYKRKNKQLVAHDDLLPFVSVVIQFFFCMLSEVDIEW